MTPDKITTAQHMYNTKTHDGSTQAEGVGTNRRPDDADRTALYASHHILNRSMASSMSATSIPE